MAEVSKEDESTQLADFGSRLLRGPKGGVYERILAQHLIESINAQPLHAILHVTRAAMMLPPEDLEKLQIDPELVKVISFVVLKIIDRPMITDEIHQEFKVDWSINNGADYEKYIKPWIRKATYGHYIPNKPNDCGVIHPAYVKAREKPITYFIYSCYRLTEMGYSTLCSDFITWALPHIEKFTEKLSQLIQPGTYAEILKLFGKQTPTQYRGEKRESRMGPR